MRSDSESRIRAMKASREMDTLLAEKRLGWTDIRQEPSQDYSDSVCEILRVVLRGQQPDNNVREVVPYLSRWAGDACLLLNKLAEMGFEYQVGYSPKRTWPDEAEDMTLDERYQCHIGAFPGTDMCWTRASAPTLALAICRAVLLTFDDTNPDDPSPEKES